MPGLAALADLAGCRFAPRCPARTDSCAAALPEWREVGSGHAVRCAAACAGIAAPADPDLPLPGVPRAGSPVLELQGVSLRFPGRRGLFGGRGRDVDAVRGVSLRVAPGEFVGIVGESGSGKSSVARLVMGLERPTAGAVVLPPRRQGADRVPGPAIRAQPPPHRALPCSPRRSKRPPAGRRAARWPGRLLDDTGLPAACLPRVPAQLSGGQRQRVNIARALCVLPDLLVADEIVSGLDVSVQAQILNLLLRLGREHGIGLLFISPRPGRRAISLLPRRGHASRRDRRVRRHRNGIP